MYFIKQTERRSNLIENAAGEDERTQTVNVRLEKNLCFMPDYMHTIQLELSLNFKTLDIG